MSTPKVPTKITKSWLSKQLNEGHTLFLAYNKADGTKRTIKATKVDPLENGDSNHITVWDTEKQGWRTVVLDNIEWVTTG